MTYNILPSLDEIRLQEDIERDYFLTQCPLIGFVQVSPIENSVTSRLGARSLYNYDNIVFINASYNRDKKLSELRDGVWVKTNKIELLFSNLLLRESNINFSRGDLVVLDPGLNNDKFEILSLEERDIIPGTNKALHLSVQIDLDHHWEN